MEKKHPCHLCERLARLQDSHIIPAFVYRWMRRTSSTGYLRGSEVINRRVQDGIKVKWLCTNCEQQIGTYEKQFADSLFYPVVDFQCPDLYYGPWLFDFCVSLSWRALCYLHTKDSFVDFSETERSLLEEALSSWKLHLLKQDLKVSAFPQHLLIASEISSTDSEIYPPRDVNTGLRRTSYFTVDKDSDHIVVFTHFPCFFLMGVISDKNPSAWVGTEINKDGGVLTKEQSPPAIFYENFEREIEFGRRNSASMSAKQKRLIDNSIKTNPERVARSDTLRAEQMDFTLKRS